MATITWKTAASGTWGTTTAWSGDLVPTGTDDVAITLAGTYDASIPGADSRSIRNLDLTAGAINLVGNLALNGSATVGAAGMIHGGSTANAQGVLSGTAPGSTLLNHGVVYADTANGSLQIDTPVFTNTGLAGAGNGGILFVTANSFTNLAATVLTGGTWEVDGNSAIDFAPGPFNFGTNQFPLSTVTDNEATITLNGPGSAIFGFNPALGASGGYDTLETSLLTNGTLGTLNIIGGRDYITTNTLTNRGVIALAGGNLDAAALPNQAGAVIVGYGLIQPRIANAGTIEAQLGTLTLANGLTGAGTLRVDPGATLRLAGDYAQPILNAGTIAVPSGTLRLSGTQTGGGGFFVNANTTLDLATATAGGVAFNGAGGVLKLSVPGGFAGAITGFGAGDTIDLPGIVATGATLSGATLLISDGTGVVDSIALGGSYAGASFTTAPDGTGGTRITASGISPRHFAFEGPVWAGHTITWSLATSNYGGTFDLAHPFSHSIDPVGQAAEVAVIQQAFARWSGVANITFTQIPDAASPGQAADIRVGWGNLVTGGGGEIGQAAYQFIGNNFSSDAIVRLEDPAITALDADAAVIGGLKYHGFSSTLYQVAVHEIGHALGLDHSTDSRAVMFPTAQGVTNQDLDASDIAGIQALYGTIALPAGMVTVAGFACDRVSIQFADTIQSAAAAIAAAALSAEVGNLQRQAVTYSNGATLPTLPGGKSGLVVMHAGGGATLSGGYNAFATDASQVVTVIGGATAGQAILAASGGLAFNAGAGAGSVIAAGGNNLISVYQGAGSQYIQTGAGDDTVVMLGGNDTVDAGTGNNQILTGAGNDLILSNGADLISAGGIGAATITAGTNNPVAFFGPGSTVFNAGGGNATVVSTSGLATVNAHGGTQVWLGSNRDLVNSTGADTIIGGAGAATVNASSGNSFVFAGAGNLAVNAGAGTPTVLGASGGAMTLNGGAGNLIALSYGATRFNGGGGAATIAAFAGAMTAHGGAGSGLYLGGPGGANSIVGGSGQSIILGGGNGDVLVAGSGAGDVIQAGAGATTINAAASHGADKIYAGAGNNLILTGIGSTNILAGTGAATITTGAGVDLVAIANGSHATLTLTNFNPASDYLTFVGFPGNEKTQALASATIIGGTSERLTLSDGTTIMLTNFTGLTAASVL